MNVRAQDVTRDGTQLRPSRIPFHVAHRQIQARHMDPPRPLAKPFRSWRSQVARARMGYHRHSSGPLFEERTMLSTQHIQTAPVGWLRERKRLVLIGAWSQDLFATLSTGVTLVWPSDSWAVTFLGHTTSGVDRERWT